MTTQTRAQIDQLLTNVSQKIVPRGYVSEEILPEVNVAMYSGKIGKYGNDHLRVVNTVVAPKGGYPVVESDVRDSDTYFIDTHGLKGFVTPRDYANVLKPFDAERDLTAKLTTHLWLGKEKALADALTSTSILTQNTTLSGTAQWNDYDDSSPITNINAGIEVVAAAVGVQPDTAIMSRKVFRTLRFHPQLLDTLGYKDNRPGGLSIEEMARALEVERVLVGMAVYNSAIMGQTDSIDPVWGNDFVLAVSPKRPELEQVSLGYRLQIAGKKARQVYKFDHNEPVGSKKIVIEDEYEQLLTNVAAGYLVKAAIA